MNAARLMTAHPGRHRLLAALEALIGVAAVAGGVALVATNGLGMPVSDLAGSPFGSYVVPGLALALVVGALMLAAAAANWRPSRWAGLLSLLAGAALVVFEVVEALSIGGVRSALQPAFFCLALIPLVAGLRR
jgi:hypothetical protein